MRIISVGPTMSSLVEELMRPDPLFEAEWRAELGLMADDALPEPLPGYLGEYEGFVIAVE